jgi:hypothetical protein
MAKSTIEKIASVEEQIQQLENARKKLIQKQKDADRKARTKRLIERGAILESLIDKSETLTNEQIKVFLEKTVKTEFALKTLASVITPPIVAADTKAEIADKKAE